MTGRGFDWSFKVIFDQAPSSSINIVQNINKESLLKLVDRKAVPKYIGGDLDVPIQPLGKPVWEYYCNFEEEFEGNTILKLNIEYI
ncbi:hypothetical protein KQX54_009585 [Cotesia glomerata]|uniref:Uncharacterized protein n=1 Tax=Cotesia glomerata TaxID=32391 RepID=A0AAV7IN97_COTGL|nr:hypothetical protein KQX54_009585 [Cotesia glomerata]